MFPNSWFSKYSVDWDLDCFASSLQIFWDRRLGFLVSRCFSGTIYFLFRLYFKFSTLLVQTILSLPLPIFESRFKHPFTAQLNTMHILSQSIFLFYIMLSVIFSILEFPLSRHCGLPDITASFKRLVNNLLLCSVKN